MYSKVPVYRTCGSTYHCENVRGVQDKRVPFLFNCDSGVAQDISLPDQNNNNR